LYDGESVGIGRKGTIDKPIFLKGKFWTVDTLFYTHQFLNANPKFIYYRFCLIKWKEYNEASGVPSLNKNTLENIEISIPSFEEQTRIATILSDMDAEISALETKLEKYKKVKLGMMQNLLTGRIRLV
jgi:type I restriction enzyme S subunit